MRLVPDERSFDVDFKFRQLFVPTLTRSIFFTAYARANAKSDDNQEIEKFVHNLWQQVTAEYLEKLHQSLPGCTETAIAAGGRP